MSDFFEIFNGKLKLKNGPGCYKVTEDSLWLLSCLPKSESKYLEVGCATGVISLLLKLKNKQADIESIDIQEEMIDQALNHQSINKIDNIDFKVIDLFSIKKKNYYDCVFSNPPYYEQNSCCKINDCVRNTALIQNDMTLFIDKMLELVKPGGFLCFMAHITTRESILKSFKGKHSLQELALISKENKTAKRFIYLLKKDNKDYFSSKKVKAYCEKLRNDVLFNCKTMDL